MPDKLIMQCTRHQHSGSGLEYPAQIEMGRIRNCSSYLELFAVSDAGLLVLRAPLAFLVFPVADIQGSSRLTVRRVCCDARPA